MSEAEQNPKPEGPEPEGGTSHDASDHKARLEADIKKERDRRRALEAEIAARDEKAEAERKAAELAQAATKEELAETIKRHNEETARRERDANLRIAAAEANVNAAFVHQADDGKSDPADVLAKATELQTAYNERVLKEQNTKPIGGGATPQAGGKQVFKRSDIKDPEFYEKHKDAIYQAMLEGRIVDG